MIEPKFISDNDNEKLSRDYEALRALGISYIEKYSGNQWTDYNYHDPGITLLEQICYAITDLGYRTNFPIADVLLSQVDSFDLADNNLLHGADKVLPTSAVTQDDYRKTILDQFPKVRNIWIQPITNHPLGIHGLFELQVQLQDDIPTENENKVLNELKNIFATQRSLSTDIEQVILLKKDEISLSGKIHIDSFMVGEDILAQIYESIQQYLNHSNEQKQKEDHKNSTYTEQRYTGPKLENQNLKHAHLRDKTNEIYRSELVEIIESISGIIALEDLMIYKNGVKCFDNIITFDKDRYPALAQLDANINTSPYALQVYRNNYRYEVDASIFHQLFEALSIGQNKTFQELREVYSGIPNGRFNPEEMQSYYSVQQEFPAVYGLKENELPANSTRKRVAQARQLKAYLLLFEQVMANHLSQLTHVRELFSVNENHLDTYFNQIPKDVPHLKEVIDFNNLEEYQEYLNNISGTEQKKLERKHQFIDHLIARYGEHYDTATIDKLDRMSGLEYDTLGTLKAKMRYARSLVTLGHDRNKAQIYATDNEENTTVSGLQQRIELLLNIPPKKNRSITSPLIDAAQVDEVKKKWVTKDIKGKNGNSIRAYSIEDDNYSSEGFEFYCKNYEELKDLFTNGIKEHSYQVHQTDENYNLIFKRTGKQQAVKIYQSESLEKCKSKQEKAIKRFVNLNQRCEGLYLIENLLLRPQLIDQFHLEILRNGTLLFKSIIPKDIDSQTELKKEIISLGKDSMNYSIVKDDSSGDFQLVVYDLDNNAIIKSVTTFNDKDAANEAITDYCDLFADDSIKGEIQISLTKAQSSSHQFPENFKYNNHITILCPDWPLRFQNKEFKDHLNECISEYIPAHLSHNLHFLTISQMTHFEDIHDSWTAQFITNDKTQKEKYALQLIQLLSSYDT